MTIFSIQQRRQCLDSPIPNMERWSWLNGADGRKKKKPLVKTRHRQWKKAMILILMIIVLWIVLRVYFYETWYPKQNVVDLRSQETNANNSNGVPTTLKQKQSLATLLPIPAPDLVKMTEMKRKEDLNVSLELLHRESHHRGLLPGGPVSVRHNTQNVIYPGANPYQLHGILGHLPNGTPMWKLQKTPEIIDIKQALKEGGGFNILVSDSISLDREATDNRHYACKKQTYDVTKLSEVSVIIVFYNEPFSTLMRSVHSVLNRTPPLLLREIILVDDSSTSSHIISSTPGETSMLEHYIALLPKVKLIRNPTRTGIVGARLLGIENCKSDIFVILDSHIEVQPVWLEPLVQRIQEDKRRVVMPQINSIDPKTFAHQSSGVGCTLGMIWRLMEHDISPSERNPSRMNRKVTDIFESPTMAGGLFAAHRNYFLDIGGYDMGMKYWGVENLELSFRLWQCGGVLECSPCSSIYHIFRNGIAYSIPDPMALQKNRLRTMAVWMDEYADLVWNVLGRPTTDFGNVSDRLELRQRLKCKPFSYFLNNVWLESDIKNLTRDVPYMGRLRNIGMNLCLTANIAEPHTDANLNNCSILNAGMMYFRRSGRIMPTRNDEACLNNVGRFKFCNFIDLDDARWRVTTEGQIVLEPSRDTYVSYIEKGVPINQTSAKLCLAVDPLTRKPKTVHCGGKEKFHGRLRQHVIENELKYQQWEWEIYKPSGMWTHPPIINEK